MFGKYLTLQSGIFLLVFPVTIMMVTLAPPSTVTFKDPTAFQTVDN